MIRFTKVAAFAALASLALVACGDDKSSTTTAASTTAASSTEAPSSTAPTTQSPSTQAPATDGPDDPVTPQRIVSLSPSGTEILFAIGAGDQVVAVDDFSTFPAEALELPHDLSGYQPNVEAIAGYQPDLVVHDGHTDLEAQLDRLGIASFIDDAPVDTDGVYARIEQLGAATGHIAEAAALVAQMTTDITDALEAAPDNPGLTYFHELDGTLYSVTSNTFVGQVYAQFGLTNIADAAAGGSDYPQLSSETVVAADPDLIFLADSAFGESVESVSARPGWAAITAVIDGSVFEIDPDLASRWGPRYPQLFTSIAQALASVPSKV